MREGNGIIGKQEQGGCGLAAAAVVVVVLAHIRKGESPLRGIVGSVRPRQDLVDLRMTDGIDGEEGEC